MSGYEIVKTLQPVISAGARVHYIGTVFVVEEDHGTSVDVRDYSWPKDDGSPSIIRLHGGQFTRKIDKPLLGVPSSEEGEKPRDYLKEMIEAACKEDIILAIGADGTTDYRGSDPVEAYKHATACDEVGITLLVPNGPERFKWVGTAVIVNGNDPDEVIADTDSTGWCSKWWDAHGPNAGERG